MKETGWRRAVGLLLALHYINENYPRRFYWKLTTGRLPNSVEWSVIKRVKSNKLSEAYLNLQRGFEWLKCFRDEDKAELMSKGWLKKSDIKFAEKISKYLY